LAASAQYTRSRSLDDASTFSGGVPPPGSIAQDWQHPHSEWAPSGFDQPHVFAAQAQYTLGADRLRGGWLAAALGGWTIAGDLNAASGRPLTPVVLVRIPGTGFVGIRPDLTGVGAAGRDGRYADPDAFAPPADGHWGNAPRHSVRGPAQFRLDLSIARPFAWGDRRSIEWRIDVSNVLDRVTFSDVHMTVGSPLFGRPSAANSMRKIVTAVRVRF
jgi:hypothetical protein